MQNTNPLVSIIMPAFNAEKSIGRAIESVLNQTYSNLELIIINDGSTDGTSDVVRKYKDVRIRLIEQLNAGPSGARNTGLTEVTGKYVVFIDSDDWYETDYVEKMISSKMDNQHQLVVCGMILHKKSEKVSSVVYDSKFESFWENVDFLRKFEMGIMNAVWNKLYEVAIIRENNITFTNIAIVEDLDFNLKYLEYVDSVRFIPYSLYHYDNNFSVLTTRVSSEMFDNYIHIHAWLFSKVPIEYFSVVSSFVYHQYVSLFVRYFNSYFGEKVSKKELYNILRKYLSNPLVSHAIKNHHSKVWGEKVLNKLFEFNQFTLLSIYLYLVNKREKG